MCGIAGIIRLTPGSPSDKDEAEARLMTAALRHRGPDSMGILRAGPCVLGNTRLKILDLSSAADLPMSAPGGSAVIAYNGEVTNFRDLEERHSLRRKRPFATTSDTETLLHLYAELGIDFLSELSGQFAFILYDRAAQKVHIVRDFFGIRPVFYLRRNGRLYAASELKSFLELDGFDRALDEGAVYDYFSLAYIPGASTPYRDVKELRAGCRLEVNLATGEVSEIEYYSPTYRTNHSLRPSEAAEKVHGLMLDSVRRNLLSDAPAGLTLSGGFDTSALLALAKELGVSRGVHTFSIRMNEPSFDESRYQDLMAGFAGTIHHRVTVDPEDVLAEIKTHMAYLDEPSGDGAAIPTFLLAREARKHVKTLLSGEGGDEVFNAYETHGAYAVSRFYRRFVPGPARALARSLARALPSSYAKLSLDFRLKRFTEGAELDPAAAHLYWRHVLTEEEKRALLPGLRGRPETAELFRKTFDKLDFEEGLNKIALLDLKYFFTDDLMVKNDRMMMAHSVEARFPYLDRPLVDFVSTLPSDLKMKGFGFSRRHIQKKAMAGLLPPAILRRANMGLEMPHAVWFLGKFRALGDKYFSRERVGRCGLLDFGRVDHLWREHLARRRDNGRALWCVLMFQVWFDLFIHDGNYKDYLSQQPPSGI
ncbi:MAG TPA: asparagine synthase (glutamine-hydrolyzing) [Elusimicrobia bacterium]|nr:MAG: asparagine synthase (glutamine-hydrolyzing) [Elusimicrobia bacterium GWD2_63_28]HCC48350.1 asparagine synthase (glutamine-hydrolyzing) [Elusimicrobiota bacterium]